MAIKGKDGNVYKLRGPNPLTKDMANWDQSSVKLINLGWKSEVVNDERNPVKQASDNIVNISQELNLYEGPEETHSIPARVFLNEMEATIDKAPVTVTPSIEIEVIEPPVDEPISIDVDHKVARILQERGVEYYCAPVIGYKKFVDDLYGTSYESPKYGTSFIFDAVVIDFTDLELQFWCVKDVTKDSIVYRKNSQGGERWWRIEAVEAKTGGYLCNCTISDLNPDFS